MFKYTLPTLQNNKRIEYLIGHALGYSQWKYIFRILYLVLMLVYTNKYLMKIPNNYLNVFE